LVAEDGRRFLLEGHKTLHHSSALRAWGSTTTLAVTMYDEHHHAVGTGVLHIAPSDLLRQLTTMRIPRATNLRHSGKMLTRFGRRFARELLTSYGGALAESHRFDEVAQPHTGREVRLAEPESTWCHPSGEWRDAPGPDAFLRLTRYAGGSKGPVMLVSGFGMSTAAFVTDTIHTNLTEYLVAHGYDVWLFDVRWDPDLPSSITPFDIDDIARVDWPTGVEEVRRRTGGDTVQVVAHCFGSMTFLMAMLSGMTGVRSAVCSQVTTHPVMTPFNKARTQVRTGRILQGLGVRTISPDVARTVPDEILDLVLRLVPIPRDERCGSAVCRWINAFYGPTHHHAQLNQATCSASPASTR
jgi:cholesterol oxidase